MATKNLTIRVDELLYKRLYILKKAVNISMNKLVCNAVDKYVEEQSAHTAQELQELATALRAYRNTDPDLKKSLRSFAEAEGRNPDPLEGEVVDTADNVPQTKLQQLLNG